MHLLDLVFNLEHLNEIDVSFPQSLTVNKKLEYLQKASWMNKLESLGCALLECPDTAFSTLELGSFSQLRTIRIEGSVPSLLCLFRAMSSPLVSVNITTDIGDNWLGFRQCLHFLAVNSGKDVTTFTLRRPGRGPAPFIPSFSNIYPPLLNMHSIRSVEINMPFSIIDDDITQLTKAWANLRSIRVRQPLVNPSARPGFGAYVGLVEHCPSLHTIMIDAYWDGSPPSQKHPFSNTNVTFFRTNQIIITNDDADHLQKIAEFVYRLFPNARLWNDNVNGDDRWRAVSMAVEGIRGGSGPQTGNLPSQNLPMVKCHSDPLLGDPLGALTLDKTPI